MIILSIFISKINVVDLNDPNRKSVTAYHYGVISAGSVIGLEPNADFWVTVQVFNTAGQSFYSERTRISTNAERKSSIIEHDNKN
jgi:hypothetical protein